MKRQVNELSDSDLIVLLCLCEVNNNISVHHKVSPLVHQALFVFIDAGNTMLIAEEIYAEQKRRADYKSKLEKDADSKE